MSTKYSLTQEQYNRIVEEIDELKNVLIPANSKALRHASEQGDLSENAEYDDAKEQQGKLHQRLNELMDKKLNAVIIQKSSNTEFVEVGHKVTLTRFSDNTTLVLTLLGQWDGTSETTSIDAPIGSGMLGKKRGERFSIDAPVGELEFEVIRIE